MLAEVHCNCQTVTLKQGARGKERITTGITSCVHFKVVLARLMGRPTCLRSGPLGLALCGGPSWVQAGPPIVRQCQHRSLVSNKVTVAINFQNSRHESSKKLTLASVANRRSLASGYIA